MLPPEERKEEMKGLEEKPSIGATVHFTSLRKWVCARYCAPLHGGIGALDPVGCDGCLFLPVLPLAFFALGANAHQDRCELGVQRANCEW